MRGSTSNGVMSAIGLLGERDDLEISPFVYSWNPGVSEVKRPPRGILHHHRYIRGIKRGVASRFESDLAEPLADFIRTVVDTGGDGSSFRQAYRRLQRSLVDVLARPGDVSYLDPLLDLANIQGSLYVGTLNYDLTMETRALQRGVPVDTGVERWIQSGEWNWPSVGIRLLKLHGPIDWEGRTSRDGTLPQYILSTNVPQVLGGGTRL